MFGIQLYSLIMHLTPCAALWHPMPCVGLARKAGDELCYQSYDQAADTSQASPDTPARLGPMTTSVTTIIWLPVLRQDAFCENIFQQIRDTLGRLNTLSRHHPLHWGCELGCMYGKPGIC